MIKSKQNIQKDEEQIKCMILQNEDAAAGMFHRSKNNILKFLKTSPESEKEEVSLSQ